ncbi:unnamed protein product [Trichobilharzia szidati]|nr:unnamed protein product [Trichobilharzia szidati]
MIVFISIVLSAALMGYVFCFAVSKYTVSKRIQQTSVFRETLSTPTSEYLASWKHSHESPDTYFDHTKVTIGSRSNAALQTIFDLLLKEYIDFWYKPLTSNPDFMIQLKMFVQYACAIIVQRVKNVEFSEFLIHRFIPHFFDHVVNILSLASSDKFNSTLVGEEHNTVQAMKQKHFQKRSLKSCSEEIILCAFGDRLHPALYSRQAEVMYLRAVVSRLLPFLGLPPSLTCPDIHKSGEPSVDHVPRARRNRMMHMSPGRLQSSSAVPNKPSVPRSASSGALGFQKLVKLGCNPSAYSLLIEILSTCVLLPAMDILANSDFLNQLILLCFTDNTNAEPLRKESSEHVPLLEAYIHDWQKWLSKKPPSLIHLDTLLSHQDELYPFMQYMKSMKSIGPLTLVLLMHQINSRVSKSVLSSEACHEVEAQIRHILIILRGGDADGNNNSSWNYSNYILPNDNDGVSDSDEYGGSTDCRVSTSLMHQGGTDNISLSSSSSSKNNCLHFYNVSNEFAELLETSVKYCSPETLTHLINTSQWKKTYQSVCKAVEFRFLPMYFESPEYIKHSFGFTLSLMSSASLSKFGVSPKRSLRRFSQNVGGSQQQQQQTGLFGSAIMNVFGSQSTDGQSSGSSDSSRMSISSTRRNQRDRLGSVISEQSSRYNVNMNSTPEELLINQHVSGIKHLPERSQQIDLSKCTVHIRGLSRPEVSQSTRLPVGTMTLLGSTPLMSSVSATTATTMNATISHTNQINHLPSSMSNSIPINNNSLTSSNFIPVSTTAVRDVGYKNKISNELNNLTGPPVLTQSTVTNSTNSMPQLSPQFMFNVITETVINGVRRQVARVTRKYSEFYVLEQKLTEFHGSFITKQLPRRQLTPRSMEFLESKCEVFESYLQYLVAQPFLRKSKLLYSFLTSNEPFNTNLFDLNLGRFVKSVPLKLTKEKGQFLDDFLTSYYLSCHTQPIGIDKTPGESELAKLIAGSNFPAINSPVNSTLTFNSLLNDTTTSSSEYSSLPNTTQQLLTTMPKSISSHFKSDKYSAEKFIDYYGRYVLNSIQYKSHGRTSLDHRLRSRVYWNNAGLTYEKRRDKTNDSSQISTVHLDGLSEMILYLFDKLTIESSTPTDPQSLSSHLNETETKTVTSSESISDCGNASQTLKQKKSTDPWDVTNPCWSEALLNGPSLPIIDSNSNNNNNNCVTTESQSTQSITTTPTATTPQLSSSNEITSNSKFTNTSDNIQTSSNSRIMLPTVSISLHDLFSTLQELYTIIQQEFKIRLRQLILRIGIILITYFKTPIDNWLSQRLLHYFHSTFSDENLASMLETIKTNIFHYSAKKVDMDKSERKEKARAALEKAILGIKGLSYVTDPEKICDDVNFLFDCFQYSKWNKQLTYVLLDQFILELFPELALNNNSNNNNYNNPNNNADVRKETCQ